MSLTFAPNRIEMWPIGQLQLYVKNTKAGHGRVLAATPLQACNHSY